MDVKTWVRGMLPLILWNKTHANLQEIKLETAIKSAWTFAYGVAWSQRSGNDSENYLPIQEGLSLTLVLAANRGKIIKIGRSEHVRLENHPLGQIKCHWKIISIVGSNRDVIDRSLGLSISSYLFQVVEGPKSRIPDVHRCILFSDMDASPKKK